MTLLVGIVKPSKRPGRGEDLDPILPPGIRIVANHLDIYSGSPDELTSAITHYDAKVREHAAAGCALIHPAGVPPLMLGYEGERRQIAAWQRHAGVPVFTNGSSQVNALRALGARRIVGLSYFPLQNDDFRRYYSEAGFDVLTMAGLDVAFQDVIGLPRATIERFVRRHVRTNPASEALLLIGPAWRTMELVDGWEREFGLPVVHHVQAQSWEMQRLAEIRHPLRGWGRLVTELPALPS